MEPKTNTSEEQPQGERIGPNGEKIIENEHVIVSIMSKDKPPEPGVMPSNEQTVYLDIFSKEEGKHYTGDFTWKRLNLTEMATVGSLRARMNGGYVDDHTDFINLMLAHLSRAVVKAPEWAKDPGALFDMHVVSAIYYEVMKFEARFRKAVRG